MPENQHSIQHNDDFPVPVIQHSTDNNDFYILVI